MANKPKTIKEALALVRSRRGPVSEKQFPQETVEKCRETINNLSKYLVLEGQDVTDAIDILECNGFLVHDFGNLYLILGSKGLYFINHGNTDFQWPDEDPLYAFLCEEIVNGFLNSCAHPSVLSTQTIQNDIERVRQDIIDHLTQIFTEVPNG